jgi:hypothetical protein
LEKGAGERHQGRGGRGKGVSGDTVRQLPLIAPADDALFKELASLDINGMTPLEALNRLYELQRKAKEGLGQ